MINGYEPIHPIKDWGNEGAEGLSKREWMATKVMQGILANSEFLKTYSNKNIEEIALIMTDDLIDALNKPKHG